MLFRADFPYTLRRDLYKHFFDKYTALPSIFDTIFDVQDSEAAQEVWTSATGMGIPVPKKEGESIKFHAPFEDWEVIFTHESYADGLEVSHELAEDSQKLRPFVQRHANSWAKGVSYLKEKIAASIFNDNPIIYDGTNFFSDTHPNKVGGTFDNNLSLALDAAGLETAIYTLENTNAYDERGEKILIKADTLLVHPALKFTAAKLLNSTLMPGEADNDINPLKGILNLVSWPFLSSPTAWYVGCVKEGVVFFNREGPIINTWIDNDRVVVKASVYWRGCAGVHDWRFWVRGHA